MYSSANETPPKNLIKAEGVDEKVLFIAQTTNEQNQTPKEKSENLEENTEKL